MAERPVAIVPEAEAGAARAIAQRLGQEGCRVGLIASQFDWARNKLPVEYQPVGEVFDPSGAGEAAWRAVKEGPREFWVGGSAIQAITGQMIAPGMLDRYISKTGWDQQETQKPNPHVPDNLFETPPGDLGVRRRFGARAKPRAMILDPARARAVLGLAGAGSHGLLAALRLRRS